MYKSILSALVLAAALPMPVMAAPDQASTTFSYADLDLSKQAGVERLNHRISAAIKAACAADPGERILSVRLEARKCLGKAKASAVSQRNHAIAQAKAASASLAIAAR